MCSHRGSKDRCHLPTASWPLQRSSGEDTGQATTCAMALSGRRGQWKGGQWGVSLVYQSGPAACLDLPSVPCMCSPGAADLSAVPALVSLLPVSAGSRCPPLPLKPPLCPLGREASRWPCSDSPGQVPHLAFLQMFVLGGSQVWSLCPQGRGLGGTQQALQ